MNIRSSSRTGLAWRWMIGVCCLGVVIAVIVQSHTISLLRHENDSLRSHPQPGASNDPGHSPMFGGGESSEVEQLRRDRAELLRLRDEVRQLREQVAPAGSDRPGITPQPTPVPTEAQAHDEAVRLPELAATRGDPDALEKLAKLAVAARAMNTNEQTAALSEIRLAFDVLGAEAGKGNATALHAIWQATRMQDLQGFAVHALGDAAGQGNEEALKPLLDPESYLILRSSAVAALKPAADAGNLQAIQALATTAGDQNQQALWYMAAQGLETAAGAGNVIAIDALASLGAAENQNVRRQAVFALEAAALKKQPRAEDALRKLGWR